MTFNIYTLGCKVNTYESNVISDKLINAGFEKVELTEQADISIINTCTVTNQADNKSMKIIKHAKKQNPNAIIVACGCFVQNKEESLKNDPNIDIIVGNIGKSKIAEYIKEYIKNKEQQYYTKDIMNTTFEEMKLNNFNKTRAFVKIQDGCNNFCSYCVIPYARGNVRSKKREDVLNEIQQLVENGHKEVVLTGIHTGNYGEEFENYKFANLLEEVVKIKGLERLRISSIEMNELNDEVLKVLKNSNIIVDHIHIPLQSGSDSVLKRMNRKYTKQQFIDKIEEIRNIRPLISITTDVIVGFPGETIDEFNETIETIKKVKFTKIHVFPYSKRDKTVAATLPNQIDGNIKKERVKILLDLSKELELEYMNKFIDKKIIFIPEIIKNDYIIGHTGNYLLVKTKGNIEQLNKDVEVQIKKIEYPYVIAE